MSENPSCRDVCNKTLKDPGNEAQEHTNDFQAKLTPWPSLHLQCVSISSCWISSLV